jgi:hypothetical protein
MPDYCINNLVLKHPNRSKLEEAVAAYNEGRLLSYFISPQDKFTHDWATQNWGTDREIYGYEPVEPRSSNSVSFYFCTAWCPAWLAYYAAVDHHGFELELYYYQSGSQFCGYTFRGKGNWSLATK